MSKLTTDQKTILLELRRMVRLKKKHQFWMRSWFCMFLIYSIACAFFSYYNSSNSIGIIISKIASNFLSKILTVLLGGLTLFHYNSNWNLYKEILQLSSKLPFEYRNFFTN